MSSKNCLKKGARNFFLEMKTINKMLSIEPNIVVCTSFFQQATPGTQKIPFKNCFKRGGGGLRIFFLEMKTINRMLSIEPNIVVCTSFFK